MLSLTFRQLQHLLALLADEANRSLEKLQRDWSPKPESESCSINDRKSSSVLKRTKDTVMNRIGVNWHKTSSGKTLIMNERSELGNIFICKSCVEDINHMLRFVEKCLRSEAILRQASEVKAETRDESHISCRDKSEAQFKVESGGKGGDASEALGFELDDVPLSFYNVSSKNENDEEIYGDVSKCPKTLSSVDVRKSEADVRSVRLVKHDDGTYRPHLCKRRLDGFDVKRRTKREKTCQNASAPSKSELSDCENKINSEKKRFWCHCGRTFDRKKKLEFHVDSVHEKKERPRKYHCPECDKKFLHPYALKNHANTHLGVKPFLCNACGSAFAASSNLTSHYRRVHSGEKIPSDKTYLCHKCGESFARASHLKRHTLRKHVPNAERKHECPVCKKRFLEKSDVTGHVKLHDDRKPFVCDRCSKCFRTSWRLQAHVKRVHLGLRPFECPTCSLKFKTKSHLEKHIRTHTGEKPFPCPHCTYACAEKSNLKKHINIHLKRT